MIDTHILMTVLVIALITVGLRFLPFIIWSGNKKLPAVIEKFGRLLPYAIMGMLVVYCLKDVNFYSISGFAPQLIACIVVAVLYIWKRNTLISIVFGTISYMILIQLVF